MQRLRSKSIADLFAKSSDDEEDSLLPKIIPFKNQSAAPPILVPRCSRALTKTTPLNVNPRRQSLAEVLRKPTDLKNDLKKLWSRRPSLNAIRTQFKQKIIDPENAEKFEEMYGVPAFYVVDRSAWNLSKSKSKK